ncbi:D-cysteine desulfhydrase family protein [Geminicoccus flavidas]|uniref:D-cysteine desulfhydrase family protein n=1 Tax=Geminicoccus flavidas TaxID=2506407 RepID=UPI0013581974|nr:D-cysteine desulfhydrase family protein [Geminicoccus flavidas]
MTTPEALRAKLDALPRIRLAHLPTPLEFCPRLTEVLGGPRIWLKRDDTTGLAFGGNKTRQLEYVFADMLKKGCNTIVAGAYTQSNWCRQMSAAAAKLGLDIHLVVVHGEKGPKLQGNFLLFKLLGAQVTVVDLPSVELLQPYLDKKADELRAQGRKPYLVAPMDLQNLALGAVGYVDAGLELHEQFGKSGIDPAALYIAGANMTPAGIALAFKALGRKTRVVNVAPIKWEEDRATDIARIANRSASIIGMETKLAPADFDSHDEYIGERYGIVTDGCREALQFLARTEGVILDPVYSGKAFAGLIDQVRKGRFGKDQDIVFVHTGGTPALFAYAEDLGLSA